LAVAALRHLLGEPGFLQRVDESGDNPSIVVTDLPATSDIWVWHENARLPSMCTMQAPHRPVPQPNLVPVSLRSSRITHNNGMVGGALLDAALPFTVKLMAMVALPHFANGDHRLAVFAIRNSLFDPLS
jgi:hypothetical protein